MAAPQLGRTEEDTPVLWRPLSLTATLRDSKHAKASRMLVIVWVAATLLCIGLGIYQVNKAWNGLPMHLGPLHFSVTIYPPLVICTCMTFWLGFEWAFLAAYLATWVLALYTGMPFVAASLFALVDPLALAVYALAYRTARLSFDLRQGKTIPWFIVVSFVAAVAGSTGSFIWSEARGLSGADALAIWQGWWVGALLQALLLNAPLLALFSRRIDRLKQRYFDAESVGEPSMRWIAATIATGGLVVAGFLATSSELASSRLANALATGVPELARRAILDASFSWKLTAWAGMALTLSGSLCGIFLAYLWNRSLFREVGSRTAELQESEQRFRVTFEQAAVGIGHVGLDGKWLRVNQKLCDIVGYSREELLQFTFQDITCLEDLGADLANVQKMLAGELTTYTMEKRYIRKNDSLVWVQLTVALARGPRNEPRYFISIIEDIDQRKLLEEQLRQSQKMEAVGRLAGGVAHDFNNLLTVISGYGEMMVKAAGPHASLRQNAQAICAAADRAAALTQQLLAFSRRQIVQPRLLDLNDVVAQMQHMLQRLIGGSVELATICHTGAALIRIDPGQIEQVIVNLAVNARDSMPEGGTVTIEVGRTEIGENALVTLEVRDTGTGMSPEVQARLFEPFFTTKARGKGTGLGLSIVYGIVKQAGGTIAVETRLGRGTVFRIFLPQVQGVRSEPQPKRTAEQAAAGSETVLLVEDEDALRNLTAGALRASGYTVLEAATGEDALRVCAGAEGSIQLLVTDMDMPGMNGRALATQLRSSWPHVRVLYMSGLAEESLDLRELAGPVSVFLQKPFLPSVLVQHVREVLDAPR